MTAFRWFALAMNEPFKIHLTVIFLVSHRVRSGQSTSGNIAVGGNTVRKEGWAMNGSSSINRKMQTKSSSQNTFADHSSQCKAYDRLELKNSNKHFHVTAHFLKVSFSHSYQSTIRLSCQGIHSLRAKKCDRNSLPYICDVSLVLYALQIRYFIVISTEHT